MTRVEPIDRPLDLAALVPELPANERVALLDSGGAPGPQARFTILALDPSQELVAPVDGAFLDELERVLAARRTPPPPSPLPFTGGAVGYLGYELLHEIEPVVERSAAPPLGLPDAHLLFCDTVLVTDRIARRSWLAAPEHLLPRARELAAAAPTLGDPLPGLPPGPRLTAAEVRDAGVRPHTPRARYIELIEEVRERIRAGDIFELCLTRRFDAGLDGPAERLYDALRTVNPAPMGAFLRLGADAEILSSSPERFLALGADGVAETRPIKGTRPRAADSGRDRALRDDLATAAKDHAEHVMIVDVSRNDLGRVCEYGSVHVAELAVVEAHPSVFQLVSTVRGRLRPDRNAVDLIRAAFPGGSMTGAPKIQAMRLISALEDSRRGVYSGAIGYIGDGGTMDLNIVIRTLVRSGDRLTFHTGGAITADSDAVAEEQETLDKAAALVRALAYARPTTSASRAAASSRS